jgi:hypothetical protein
MVTQLKELGVMAPRVRQLAAPEQDFSEMVQFQAEHQTVNKLKHM